MIQLFGYFWKPIDPFPNFQKFQIFVAPLRLL